MGLCGTLPIIWGFAFNRLDDAVWIALTAEAISWMELKGSFAWRVRILLSGALLAIFFSLLGIVTGLSIGLSILCMFGVGFVATLLKNTSERASGLAICVYLPFIISNAYPAHDIAHFEHRASLIVIGAIWPVAVGIAWSLFSPEDEPFRRQIALIWRSISVLVETISRSGADESLRAHTGGMLEKENEVRAAIDKSYEFYGHTVDQVQQKEHKQYQLAQLRKTAALAGVNVIAMGEEMAHINVKTLDESLRVKAATLFSAMKEAIGCISVFIISLDREEKARAISHINRLKTVTSLIAEYPLPPGDNGSGAIRRILHLTERTTRLLENALQRIEEMGVDMPVYKSYSFKKTASILRANNFVDNMRSIFNLNMFTTRNALRSAIAVTFALLIAQLFKIDHGYWLPFSVMIIMQPYFGATFKRAIQRVAGTLLGGIAGSLLLHLPAGLHLKEVILFATFVLMVYYLRKQYAIAAFVITLNLVLLFNLQMAYNNELMITRALCTIGGAALAVTAGFALLPNWDKNWLPSHLAGAIKCNYEYFIATFFSHQPLSSWTKHKRSVESKNSSVFDSFNRYMQEPGKEKSELYYDLITYNVRITRDLNTIHMEQDEKRITATQHATDTQQEKINEAYTLFNELLATLKKLDNQKPKISVYERTARAPFLLDDAQMISLEKLIIELRSMLKDLDKMK